MLKGIIFDMDGTITLTEPLHHKAFADVFMEFGIEYPFADHIKRFAGSGSKLTFSTIFTENNIKFDDSVLAECSSKKHDLYRNIVQESEISTVPGAKEFIDRIFKRGLRTIIATGNSDLEAVRDILKKVHVLEYFPEIISITEVPRGKPFPDVFIEAAKRIGCSPSECVVLEDSANGVKAAVDARIRCIAFDTTTKKDVLLKTGAFVVLTDYNELSDALLNAK